MQLLLYFTPPVLKIAQALSGIGLATPEGLAVVAKVWRCVKVPSLNWEDLRDLNHDTLDKLDEKGLLKRERAEEVSKVIEDWPFPLYPLDLAPKEVSEEGLEQARARWAPDFRHAVQQPPGVAQLILRSKTCTADTPNRSQSYAQKPLWD